MKQLALILIPTALLSCRTVHHRAPVARAPGHRTALAASLRDLEQVPAPQTVELPANAPALLPEVDPAPADELSEATPGDNIDDSELLRFADHSQRLAVRRWLHYFTHKDRTRFARFLNRGLPYKELIETLLAKEGVPPYFYYLAMIESGFSVGAHSRAKAVGIWQFMRATGKRYGLQVNAYVDERRDPIRATVAAARYLKDLHNVFHSWFLAMSAYNAGESRVMNTIMRHGSRDFWELARLRALPPETRNYVPKFIAAALIGQNPKRYGFALAKPAALPSLQGVNVRASLPLAKVASRFGVSLAALRRYNPQLRGSRLPPRPAYYQIWLPHRDQEALALVDRRL